MFSSFGVLWFPKMDVDGEVGEWVSIIGGGVRGGGRFKGLGGGGRVRETWTGMMWDSNEGRRLEDGSWES